MAPSLRRAKPAKRAKRVRRLAGFPAAGPEAGGLSREPLDRLRAATRLEVRELGCLAGAAHVVLQQGKCVAAITDGWSDREQGVRFGLDTICKLHGCTKPLMAAAFLSLVDEGKVRLSDPVSKYISFSDQVAGRGRAKVRPVRAPATLRHLLTMTGGLKYDSCPAYATAMRRVRSGAIADLAGLCEALAAEPLQAEPGDRFEYGFCADALGRVCEAVSGERLDAFVERRLLRPLGMKDSHFVVPPRKRRRVAVQYQCEAAKGATRAAQPYVTKPWDHPLSAPGIMSGGGGVLSYKDPGMLSTARDYARFLQMLLDGGRSQDGRCVLRPSTVRSLWRDGLAQYNRPDGRLPGWNDADGPAKGGYWDHVGWSLLNTHLVFDGPPKGRTARQGRSMWMGGGGGTYWVIDPRKRTVSVSFTQTFGGRSEDDGLGPRGGDASPFVAEAAAAVRRR